MTKKLLWSNVSFIKGAVKPAQYPDSSLPEVAFVGRSNVGKSSLLNVLFGRTRMVHVSKAPGKTAEINFFNVHDTLICVDLPGYGYARVSKKMLLLWQKMLPTYFAKRKTLQHVFVLVDGRHLPKAQDIETYKWLVSLGRQVSFLITKIDKASKERVLQVKEHLLCVIDKSTSQKQGASAGFVLCSSARRPETVEQLRLFILQILSSTRFLD